MRQGPFSFSSIPSLSNILPDQIEKMKQQISLGKVSDGISSPGGDADDICLLDLLGQGSFGKVYRGTWRGTEVWQPRLIGYLRAGWMRFLSKLMDLSVPLPLSLPLLQGAIKVMILPPHMSGKEKREKMLIMETAISSALCHPNIVQVFRTSPRRGRVSLVVKIMGSPLSPLYPAPPSVSLTVSSRQTFTYSISTVAENRAAGNAPTIAAPMR